MFPDAGGTPASKQSRTYVEQINQTILLRRQHNVRFCLIVCDITQPCTLQSQQSILYENQCNCGVIKHKWGALLKQNLNITNDRNHALSHTHTQRWCGTHKHAPHKVTVVGIMQINPRLSRFGVVRARVCVGCAFVRACVCWFELREFRRPARSCPLATQHQRLHTATSAETTRRSAT